MSLIKSHSLGPNKAWQKARQREIDADLKYAWTLMEAWPQKWQIDEADERYGEELLKLIKPFVRDLVENQQLSRSTLRRHLNNLWLLGGELISLINTYDADRSCAPVRLLDNNLSAEGGPLCKHVERGPQQQQYDATCKKLYAFRSARL